MAKLQLAPEWLSQSILPWSLFQNASLSGITINIGETPRPETERAILDEVGSYGRQIGRIGDALEVLIRHFDRSGLPPEEKDALTVLEGQLAQIRAIKRRD